MTSLVLGLDDTIGNFEVGKEFDALLIEPRVMRSKFVVVSNFDTVQVLTSNSSIALLLLQTNCCQLRYFIVICISPMSVILRHVLC